MTLRVKFTVATVGCLAAVMAIGAWQLNTRMAAAFEAEARNRSGMVLSFGQACRKYTKQVLRPAVAERLDEMLFEAMSSTVVTSGILAFFNEDMPSYAYRQPTLNPLNLTNKADEFEASLLADFRADRSLGETSGYRVTNGEEQFYTARPIVVEATCLECHGNPDTAPPEVLARYGREHGYNWRVGKVVAATMISVPTDDLRQKQSALMKTILVTFAALTAILFGLIFLLFDRLVNHRLRAAADMMDRAAAKRVSVFRHYAQVPTAKRSRQEHRGAERSCLKRAPSAPT